MRQTESPQKSAVLIRLDKIGDLVSTLPCDELSELQSHKVTWVIANGLSFIPENAQPKRSFIELDKNKSWQSFIKLFLFLKNLKPDVAISFQAPWWVSLALFLARVPTRSGRLSQWHSFLFFNKGLRQSRSESRMHESDYNAELVTNTFNSEKKSCPVLKLQAQNKPNLLAKFNLDSKNYFVVHPGMAGSALNWPINSYISLIEKLLNKNFKVVITGTANDEPWLQEIKNKFTGNKNFYNLQNLLSPTELLTVLAQAKSVLAPSTGVLHLSASLGTKTVGLYSPVRTQKSIRWQARGPAVEIHEPTISCPAIHSCLKEKCSHYNCMTKISTDRIFDHLGTTLA